MAIASYFATKQAENRQAGYQVDYKYLLIAFAIEIAVVYTSLHGAWLFAKTYARDADAFTMMMLAPIAYAGVELSRVPLAFALRTQTSRWWKALFALLVLCAAGVTVKSLSQLGEIMFRPRLIEVTEANTALRKARSERETAAAAIKSADAVVEQRREELRSAEDRLKQANSALGNLPKEQCGTSTRRTQRGTVRVWGCRADARQGPIASNLKDAQGARDRASDGFDRAISDRAKLTMSQVDATVDAANASHQTAVMNSQLHSFTAMFFGKDPTQVTEGEIHFFLRWFVFFPAIFASLAATGLALASVTYPKEEHAQAVEIDEAVMRGYVLEPLVDEVARRLRVGAEVERARHAAAGASVEGAGPAPASVNDNPPLDETPLKAAV